MCVCCVMCVYVYEVYCCVHELVCMHLKCAYVYVHAKCVCCVFMGMEVCGIVLMCVHVRVQLIRCLPSLLLTDFY